MNFKRPHPPSLPDRFLQWFCADEVLETLQGDLYELYEKRREKKGKLLAAVMYWADVASACRPFAFRKNRIRSNTNVMVLYSNYFKLAWRTLHKQWQYSLINIAGLAVGMACCILILLYVSYEKSYDRFHVGADRIYRVIRDDMNNAGQLEPYATTPRAMALSMRSDLPEVAAAATLLQSRQMPMRYGSRQFYEDRVYEADSNLFSVFSFSLISGNLEEALLAPRSVVITESTATKYFGMDEPIGKLLRSENSEYFITAVLKDVPHNSHFRFDMLIPLSTIEERFNTTWGPPRYYTYVRLNEDVDAGIFEKKLATYAQAKYERRPLDKFHLQALTDIHLYSNLNAELETNGNVSLVRILTTIAFFIIFMAGINYINLATARSTRRAKEVGIRKTCGALQRGLILQFLTESVLISMLAFLLAVVWVALLIQPFNQLAERHLTLFAPELWPTWFSFAGFSAAIGVVAGLYPAVYLSSLNPVHILKGTNLYGTGRSGWVRKALVCLQLTISVCLIIGTTVVVSQMNYIGSKHPGFDKEHVVVVPNARMLSNRRAMEQHIASLAGVKKVGASTGSLTGAPNWMGNIRTETSQTDRLINFCQINYDYLDALGIRLLEGRQFSPAFPADTINTIILNEAAVRDLGLTDPVGARLVWDATSLDTLLYARVVGVVGDFHFTSFHEPIKPFAFLIRNNFFVQEDFTSKLFIKAVGNPEETAQAVGELWKEFIPQRPFSYTLLNDNYENLHADEERFRVLFSCLTALGIFIVCLGLFALIAFVTEQRTKEIGIRKVLGASITGIVLLLNKDFLKLVAFATVVASPVAFYFMNRWLQDFAYRIKLEWWMFALAGLSAGFIVFFTTAYQSVKASMANPIKSLRTE